LPSAYKRLRPANAGAALLTLIAALAFSAPARATDPSLIFTPRPAMGLPGQPPPPPIPPPNGYFNGPCGLAIDSGGRVYVADGYHDVVDVFASGFAYLTQLSTPDADRDPCYLALDSTGDLYVGEFHGAVEKWSPSAYPPDGSTTYTSAGEIDPGPVTGIAVDPAGGDVYVNKRTHVSVYDSTGAHQADIGAGEIGEGYGVAVSAYGPTAGYLYVPDAAANEVKVFDAAGVAQTPIPGPPGGFTSLREASVAVDRLSGYVYVIDNLQPANAERPQALVHVFSFAGTPLGHLRYKVIHGTPSGLAVDNSTGTSSQGRVYITSGNTHEGAVYVYPPHAATGVVPLAPQFPPSPLGGDLLFPTVAIGSAAPPPGGIPCEGDACQVLPPEPVDPTLTTLLRGLGNPRVRYRRYARNCGRIADKARRKRCRAANSRARGSALARAAARAPVGPAAPGPVALSAGGAEAQALLPGTAGFDARAFADGGEAATLAGSHPYSLQFAVGLDQGGGEETLRELAVDLPAGLLANPAAPGLCSAQDFATPRSSPFDPGTTSGESCPARSQVGTVEVTTGGGGGETRRFGLFNLNPAAGTALQLGAAPFGEPLVFDATLRAGGEEAFGLTLAASEIPAALAARSLEISIWGISWDATHNTERGNCLNEPEPAFAWSKCSVGEPLNNRPLAFLTLPTECGEPLDFSLRAASWQGPGELTASAVNRDSGGDPAPMAGCDTLPAFQTFDLAAEGLLSVGKASSSTGFVFRLANADSGLANPRARIRSHPQRAVVRLPDGVTLNPSLGAGLGTCSPVQLAAETAFNPPGAGCPNGSKIGEFRFHSPFYDDFLRGGIYLAQPDHPGSGAPGAENPFDSLLAVYLVAKSADRGLLIRVPGELAPDPGDGTLTATFDGLPQIPYTDLEVNFRSGQRAPLVSPPRCGDATTQIEIAPSSGGRATVFRTDSQITSGVDFGPCPDGSVPPFAPEAVTGGVNSNVGSYTPYYIRLSRKDAEQEITSYSLVLPKGITGKLAGIPFCPEAAIAAARTRLGFEETASPSCPAASQVGRTDTGYGVGSALTYAPGRIYLAGPHGGQPLSLVTINAATVGPFDLGTIVIRSAFAVEQRTAQLQIDSSASDPIPHIIDGVPLHLRDIRVYMDRFQFTHNPSSCEPSQLFSTLTGSGASFATPADDSTATVSKHFQLLNCLTLGFRPRLGLRLRGSARRGGYPSLRASFVSRGARDSNLKRIEVEMPHSLFLAQNHIRTVCTREQFAAERCPKGSAYGTAVAETLLFDEPLRGNVYLRSSENKLPDLVADLRSGEVRIVVEGRIGPGKHGGIRTFFDNLPDAPIDRFTMTLFGGRRGLLQNSSNICNAPPLATVSALGQNNIGARFSSTLRGQCEKKNKRQKGSGHTRQRGGRR
jgi:DNA-binding beta-propeller fold protein YncE